MKIALIRGVVTIAELSNLDFQRLKNISGLRWNRTTRCMVGPVSLNLLDGLARYYKLPADMETKRQRLGKTRREIDAERLAEDPAPLLPYPVKANLYKHQIRGANMALRAFGALDAKTPGGGFGELFEMGCGKTLTTIAVAGALYNLGKIDRVLVVAPTSVCSVWPHDLNQFATFPWEARVLLGDKKKRLKALNELENWPFKALRIAVINYESTHRDGIFEALAAYKPDLIVCDESQRIKNPSAAQSKALHKLGDAAPFRMILSGTPVQNNAVDLYSQYRFLDPAVYGANFYAFKNRYCIMGGYGQHQIVGYRNMDELVEKEHSVAYRVTKEECLDLPQQTFINRYVQFTDAEQAIYEQLRKSSFLELETGENVTATTILTMYLRLMQLTGGFLTRRRKHPAEASQHRQAGRPGRHRRRLRCGRGQEAGDFCPVPGRNSRHRKPAPAAQNSIRQHLRRRADGRTRKDRRGLPNKPGHESLRGADSDRWPRHNATRRQHGSFLQL